MRYFRHAVLFLSGIGILISLLPLIGIAFNGQGETPTSDIIKSIQILLVSASVYAFALYSGWHKG